MTTLFYTVSCIFMLHCLTAKSQDSISYNQLASLMLKENPTLSYNKLSVEIAFNELAAQKANRLPDLNGTISNALNDGRSLDPITYQYAQQSFVSNLYRLQSNVTVFQGGKINATVDKFRLGLDAEKLNSENTTLNLHRDLFTQYADACMLKELLNLWEGKRAIILQLKKNTTLGVSSGRTTNTAIALIDIELNKFNQYIEELDYRHRLALLNIKSLTGDHSTANIQLHSPKNIIVDSLSYTADEIEKIAEVSPNHRLARTKTLMSKKETKIANSSLYPSVVVGGALSSGYSSLLRNNSLTNNDWNNQLNNNFYQTLSLNVYIPIFNKFQTTKGIGKSKLLYQQSMALERKEKQAVVDFLTVQNYQLQQSFKNYTHAINSIESYRQIIKESAVNYEAGRINTSDYLLILQQKISLEEIAITSKYKYLVARKNMDLFRTGSIELP